MLEARQYDQWNHTAALRQDILNALRFGKRGKTYKAKDLHLMEQMRRSRGTIGFESVRAMFVKSAKSDKKAAQNDSPEGHQAHKRPKSE